MTTPGPSAGKAEWREWARQQRKTVDWAEASHRVVDHLRDSGALDGRSRVLVFEPLPDEVDLTALVDDVVALVTRTPEDGVLTIHPFDAPRERHRLGFAQPTPDAVTVDPVAVDVALVPGLAFDAAGTRLGRGGGHYDRLLHQLRPDALVVGVCADALVVDRLPVEPHDIPMTHLVTETGLAAVGRVPSVTDPLITAALEWIAGDPDPDTRAELQALVDAEDTETVQRLMGASLRFGTAGIRGEVGPGSNRMNRATVIRVTRGLVDHLETQGLSDGPVVVGFDARPTSRTFAEDAVGVIAAASVPVHAFADVAPTPLVAHAALRLGAVAAVVVTASHNPPADNGYKVYAANGAQIIPPTDGDIADAVDRVGPAAEVSRVEGALSGTPGVTVITEEATEAYLADLAAFRGDGEPSSPRRIVYTPLHGVAGALQVEALRRAGHGDVTVVPEQAEPDGSFPTVDFPNPEEPGALDLAEALAAESDADLVLANDPDGDRLAVSVPADGGWRRLTGNEIGVLLGDFVLERTGGMDRRLVVSSIVSSPMLGAVAEAHGARWEATLTGFKWICNAALALEEEGHRFVFGFEEALGYAVGPAVRDKDGISAAVWFADLAAECAAAGETVIDRLARLHARDGLWVSAAHNIISDDPDGLAALTRALDGLAAEPPDQVAGMSVESVTDFRSGGDARPWWLPDAPLVALGLSGGSRVLARPSGTEPKLKIYADLRSEVASPEEAMRRHAETLERAADVARAVAEVFT